MVRRSILVYDLLRTEKPQNGFSEKEIVEQISNKHDIVPGKGLRRQIAVALRRGLDFGILAKEKNKFRFDPDYAKLTTLRHDVSKQIQKKKKTQTRKTRKAVKPTTKRRQTAKRSKVRKDNKSVPRPKLPNPPSWNPQRRKLNEEPITKVKKHS